MAFHVPNQWRDRTHPLYGSDDSEGNNGAFQVPSRDGRRALFIVASDGAGWEHVSVHAHDRKRDRDETPTWDDMCRVKALFWDPEDAVMQLHPPRSQYVNCHPHTLHLWRPVAREIPVPPRVLV